MDTHVKVLGASFIALSAIGVLLALFLLLVMGGAATITGVAAPAEDAVLAVPIIGAVGVGLAIFFLVLSLPGLITGWGLLKLRPWARIVGIVLSALNILNFSLFPITTIVGVYGLWVLLSKDTERLFATSPVAPGT